ncbi:MAG: sigma-70 family RNA polymerase sigma factor [Anaeromyxobacter sp.]
MDLEGQIREELAAGQQATAATRALEALGPGVLGYLFSMLEPDDARDAFSLFAEDLWKGLPGFRFECSLRGWAYRVAYRAAARVMREGYKVRREHLPTSMASRLAASIAPDSGLEPGSRRDRLAQLRSELSPEDRTLLVLRVDRGLEWDEVAAALAETGEDVSPAALRKRFERLKDRLAGLARERGLVD